MNAASSTETLAPMYYTTNSDLTIYRSDSLTPLASIAQQLALQPTSRLRLKCDGTRAETRFRLSAKRTSPFQSEGASVQSTTGSRGVRISGSNAGYIMFRGNVKGTGYPLLPLPCVTVCYHISTGLFLWHLVHRSLKLSSRVQIKNVWN